jgi:hypothetical protein
VVRYVHLPANAVDVPLLEDATRRGTFFLCLFGLRLPQAAAAVRRVMDEIKQLAGFCVVF